MQAKTVAAFITEQLREWGIRRIYGVAGDAILPWLDVLGKQMDIRFIQCRHEASAAMMASAEAKLTGRPAVCTATSGPGFVNLLNGLADAHTDHVPVIAITGQIESYKLGGGYKQYVQQENMLTPISHFSTVVADPRAIGEVLHKAYMTAAQQKGVTHLAVCQDIWAQETNHPVISALPALHSAVRLDRTTASQAAEIARSARKPMILCGVGARSSISSVQRLAEKLGAGILLSLGAKGAIASSHPQVLGGLGEGGNHAGLEALAKADLLMIFGATWFPRSYIPAHVTIIQIDENLSSFHAAEKLIPVRGNLEEAVLFLEDRLQAYEPDENWRYVIHALHQEGMKELEEKTAQTNEERVKPQKVMTALDQLVETDAIVTLDTGEHTIWFNRAFRAEGQVPLFSGKWRTMGFGLPAAIAAKLTAPDKQVVAIVGDGGLMMTLGELMTMVEYDLPITVIVLNNHGLGLEEVKMKRAGMTPFATSMMNPSFFKLAEACGIHAYRINDVGQLEEGLQTALQAGKPALVEVQTTPPTLDPLNKQLLIHTQA
ncbi:thiamine pyrophosphate-binding protein [Brevibacillus migulae]|uniref:thiamine pyrophosphate-binding protein n=1 Tax=Brevibacillus migulae TaxID=1644114 RepID=UPI00106E0A05|nr:thiamine pyrophosphate-binding protein [Brevibacillus migulae]